MNTSTAIETIPETRPDPRCVVVDRVIDDLKLLSEAATLELAIEVGRIVVDRVFGGSLGAWRRRRKSDPTFAQLAKHPELPMSAASLYRAVCVYEMVQCHPVISTWKWLTFSHLRAVINLPANEQQRVLALAQQQQWTVREIEQESTQLRAGHNRSGGRPPTKPAIKIARKLQRVLEQDLQDLLTHDCEELRQMLTAIRDRCDELLRLGSVRLD